MARNRPFDRPHILRSSSHKFYILAMHKIDKQCARGISDQIYNYVPSCTHEEQKRTNIKGGWVNKEYICSNTLL